VQTRRGSHPLALTTQSVLLCIQERRLSLKPHQCSSSHSVPTSVRSSLSQCPLQYGPTTHYDRASTVQPLTVPTPVKSSHLQYPLQYGPATHSAHTSTVQPLTVPTPVLSIHSQCPLQYDPSTHSAHASTVQPITSQCPLCPTSVIFLTYLSRSPLH
jgi:hypothetical protein